jgi:hypothetical protein
MNERKLICEHTDITFVVSAGNDGVDLDINPRYPASYDCSNIVVVANRGARSSNYGSVVSAWEDGVMVWSMLPHGEEGYMTGTSMSTAIRTGRIIYARQHP